MGEVWMAEQTRAGPPPGRAQGHQGRAWTREQVIARFEAERQALALMDHPNIARRLRRRRDAGGPAVLRDGVRPGRADHRVLRQAAARHRASGWSCSSTVCAGGAARAPEGHHPPRHQAVERAGRRRRTASASPKIIDFGVAKATVAAAHRADRSSPSSGSSIGTPEYMSPEQAEMTELDIDTRTDVYSLGVLLYELLAGALPVRPEGAARGAASPRSSGCSARTSRRGRARRISSARAQRSTVSATNRRVDCAAPGQGARGRSRLDRDEGAREGPRAALRHRPRAGADVERHLHDEPVLAGPPSGLYRVKKLLHRHRVPIPGGGSRPPRPGGRGDRHVVGTAAGDARRASGRSQRCRGPSPDGHRRGSQRVLQPESPGRRASVRRARTRQGRHGAGGARRRGRAHRGSREDRRTILWRAAGRGTDTEHSRRHIPRTWGVWRRRSPK